MIKEQKQLNKKQMLTTVDNPFDPFTQFDEWNAFDIEKGYFTCSYLARVSFVSDIMSDEQELEAIYDAMKDIVEQNGDLYKIVEKK